MNIPNTEKTIFFHIGMHKTGTTSIQYFLFKNSNKLQEYDILYPMIDAFNSMSEISTVDVTNIRKLCSEYSKNREGGKDYFEQEFLHKIQSTKCKKIILSEENFCFHPDAMCSFAEMLQSYGFQLKILVYVRPVVEWYASLWYERMRPHVPDLQCLTDFLATTDRNYDCLFKVVDKFGKDNVIIKAYEKCQWKNNNLIEDFLDIFDVQLTSELSTERLNQNVSNGRNTAELSRFISYLELDSRWEFYDKLYKMRIKEAKVAETLTDAEILALTERHAPRLKRLANKYGKDSFFVNDLPSCYGKERPIYNTVALNSGQYDILIEALETNRVEKNTLKKELQGKQKELQGKQKELQGRQAQIVALEKNVKYLKQQLNLPFIQKIFSMRREKGRRVIRILGFKIKLKK